MSFCFWVASLSWVQVDRNMEEYKFSHPRSEKLIMDGLEKDERGQIEANIDLLKLYRPILGGRDLIRCDASIKCLMKAVNYGR